MVLVTTREHEKKAIIVPCVWVGWHEMIPPHKAIKTPKISYEYQVRRKTQRENLGVAVNMCYKFNKIKFHSNCFKIQNTFKTYFCFYLNSNDDYNEKMNKNVGIISFFLVSTRYFIEQLHRWQKWHKYHEKFTWINKKNNNGKDINKVR